MYQKESSFILDTNVIIDLKRFGILSSLKRIKNLFATDLIINRELEKDEKLVQIADVFIKKAYVIYIYLIIVMIKFDVIINIIMS